MGKPPSQPKNLLWNEAIMKQKETEVECCNWGSSKMVWKMVVASLMTNARCLCISDLSVLKCGKMKPDGITDEVFVLWETLEVFVRY